MESDTNDRSFKAQKTPEKSSWYGKKSEEKEKVLKEDIDWRTMWK